MGFLARSLQFGSQRRLAVVLACALVGLLASGFTRAPSATSTGGTVVLAETAAPATLDPIMTSDFPPALQWELVYQTLVLDTKGGSVVSPLLATHWTVGPGGQVYTFYLRKGVKFSNGDTFTAADVVFSFQRLLNQGIPFSKALFPNLTSIIQTAPYTVKFVFSAPDSAFLIQLGDPTVYAGAILDHNAATGSCSTCDPAKWMIGTGPMEMVSYDPTSSGQIVYQRNPKYWGGAGVPGASPAKPSKVIVKFLPNTTSQVVALQSGQIDMMIPDATQIATLKSSSKVTVKGVAGCAYEEIDLNNNGPLADIRVRRALALAIDRSQIAQQAFLGQAVPTGRNSPCYAWSPGPKQTPYYTKDIASAKKLLAAAGYPNGLSLNINAIAGLGSANDQNQSVIAAQLAEIGVKANIQIVDDPTWLSRYLGHQYDLTSYLNQFRTNPSAVLNEAGRVGRFTAGLPANVVASENVMIGDPNPADFIRNLKALTLVQARDVFPGIVTVAPKVFLAYRKDRVHGAVNMDGTENLRFLFNVTGS